MKDKRPAIHVLASWSRIISAFRSESDLRPSLTTAIEQVVREYESDDNPLTWDDLEQPSNLVFSSCDSIFAVVNANSSRNIVWYSITHHPISISSVVRPVPNTKISSGKYASNGL
ncbi:hypothetical protein K449DRAFT_434956 [Hypoxylon sp. EC38]|nr:hypothetical protein K449DRAFT_434956 [Hypoxylon sp. EC38]